MTTELSECCPAAGKAGALGEVGARGRILTVSTIGFTLLFAVWLMFGILAIPIRAEMHLTEAEFSWLATIAIVNGSLWRLSFGMLADRLGGRLVMTLLLLFCAVPAFLVAFAHSFVELLIYAFLVGLAGNGFAAGIAWNSAWFPRKNQGFALGVFGAGNVGASVTKIIGPSMIAMVPAAGFTLVGMHVPGGWRSIPLLYSVLLVMMAVATWCFTPGSDHAPGKGRSLAERLRPLGSVRVWRFGFYYVIMFGAYVALSVWLPRYYEDIYHLPLSQAALLTALFIFPASLLRPVGGWIADQFGARRAMYGVFSLLTVTAFVLAVPPFQVWADGAGHGFRFELTVVPFTVLLFLLGVGMGVGKAAVYKYIPEYFPQDVGAVGGLVGALGGLGGFCLPPIFAYAEGVTRLPQMTFAVLFVLIVGAFLWLHLVVRRILRTAGAEAKTHFESLPGAARPLEH